MVYVLPGQDMFFEMFFEISGGLIFLYGFRRKCLPCRILFVFRFKSQAGVGGQAVNQLLAHGGGRRPEPAV